MNKNITNTNVGKKRFWLTANWPIEKEIVTLATGNSLLYNLPQYQIDKLPTSTKRLRSSSHLIQTYNPRITHA